MSEPSTSETAGESWRHLTALEQLLLRSKLTGDMVFRVELHFDGRFHLDRLQAACDIACLKHPLLCSRVESGTTCWVPREASVRITSSEIETIAARTPCPIASLPVDQAVGLAVHLLRSADNKSIISLDFDHVRTDGQGAARFIRDFVQSYFVNETSSQHHRLVDDALLRERGVYMHPRDSSRSSTAELLRNFWVTVKGSNYRFTNPSMVQAPSAHLLQSTVCIDGDKAHRIRSRIRELGYTLNDVALAASLIAIGEHSTGASNTDYVSVMNPVDLRTWADRRLSATNRFGFAFVRRQIRSLQHPPATLTSVVEQMRHVRERGIASELIQGFKLAQHVPGMLSAIEWTKWFVPTANFTCMSNSGPGRRVGLQRQDGIWTREGITLTNISGHGPLPPHVALSLVLFDSGNVLTLNVRGCAGALQSDHVKRIAESWQRLLVHLTI